MILTLAAMHILHSLFLSYIFNDLACFDRFSRHFSETDDMLTKQKQAASVRNAGFQKAPIVLNGPLCSKRYIKAL